MVWQTLEDRYIKHFLKPGPESRESQASRIASRNAPRDASGAALGGEAAAGGRAAGLRVPVARRWVAGGL